MRRILTTLMILLAVIVAGLTSLVLLVNPNDFRAYMVHEVAERSGYQLDLDGPLRWHVWPQLSILSGRMTLTARGAEEPVIRADNMRLDVALLPLLFALWEGLTAKTAFLPVPFFAPPQALIEVLHDDWPRLLDSLLHSLGLLGLGVLLGTSSGFITGLAIGWSQRIGYWVHPVLRLLGPVPSTALLPLCLFIFPSSFGASVFLIALSTWFPVTVLTWSGVMGIDKAWYDVARTLGASQRFLILRVAIPAALPNVFVGLFMGLGASFSVLIVAEMVGVKSGIGFYLQWAQGWAAYPNMYAALLVMALLCSGLISGLFMLRDRLLSWQRGGMQW